MIRKIRKKLKVISLHYNKMGFWNVTGYIFQRVYKRKRLLSAKIKKTNLQVLLRNNPYDTQVFTQIFMRDELNVHFEKPPEIIIDGGANIGLATLYLVTKYPNATIIAVEPEQSNFDLLIKNTKGYSNIFCLNKGIWDKSCRLQIIDNGDGNASFITKELIENEPAENVINAITITDIMKEFKIQKLDLLKLDIEGSEKDVFEKGYEDWLSKTQNLIIEIHPHLHPDCEKTVMAALEKDFIKRPAGEYYYFSKKRPA